MTAAPRVLILLSPSNDFDHRLRKSLTARFPELHIDSVGHHSEVGPYIGQAHVLLSFGALMTDQMIKDAEALQWIHVLGSGVDGVIDLPSLRDDVLVTSSRGAQTTAVSETVLALMFALARSIPQLVANQAQHRWQRVPPALLNGKTITILGIGAIAEVLAHKCRALGMTVTGISASRDSVPGFHTLFKRDQIRQAVGAADYFVSLAPKSPDLHGFVGADVLAAMKPGSFFINAGRGGVVDETALVDVLRRGPLAGAGLDVFETEPLPKDHPLWLLPNVIISPHLGGLHADYVDDLMPILAQNMDLFRAGDYGPMRNVIRPGSKVGTSSRRSAP